jgi:hypothetical protein
MLGLGAHSGETEMHDFWYRLGVNSAQLQAVGSVAAVIVAIALCIVAVRQAIAANSQAKAAKAQVEAANRQIIASYIVGDIQTSPNISIAPAMLNGVIIPQQMAILNNGSGTASHVKLHYRDQAIENEIGLNNDVLVFRDSLPARFDNSRATQSGFRLTYQTAFGTKYTVDFEWNVTSSRAINQRLILLSRDFSVLSLEKEELA